MPNDKYAIVQEAHLFQEDGHLDTAAREPVRLPKGSTEYAVILLRVLQAMLERNFGLAISSTKEVTTSLKPEQPLSGQNIFALVPQGYCEEWTGRREEARATFERIIAAIPPAVTFAIAPGREIRSYLALAYAGLGDKQNALEQASQAVADAGDDAVLKPITDAYRAKFRRRSVILIQRLPPFRIPGGLHADELRISPFWDPLHKDRRFQALVKNPTSIRY